MGAVVPDVINKEIPVAESEAREALRRVLQSKTFAGSARCRDFLQFVGEHSLRGDADAVKERSIGIAVFGRPADYDSADDSLVRVKARELRNRLARYYENEGSEDPVRIRIPVGGYVPSFEAATRESADAAPVPAPAGVPLFQRLRWPLASLAGIALLVTLLVSVSPPRNVVDQIWAPVLRSEDPLLIFIPVPSTHRLVGPERTPVRADDRVGIGPAAGAVQVAMYCTEKKHPVELRIGKELDFNDLRSHPTLLFGAFSSDWPSELSKGLPFELRRRKDCGGAPTDCIVDTQSGEIRTAVKPTPDLSAERDVAMVARVMDERTGRPMLLAAGLTTYGTQAAAEFLLNPTALTELRSLAGADWAKPNFQVLLDVPIIQEAPGKPRILATRFW